MAITFAYLLALANVGGLQIYAHFQSEFSFLKANLMAVASIVAIFPVNARMHLDGPISSAAGIQPGGRRAVNTSPRNRGIER
jgi:hypothetical protein